MIDYAVNPAPGAHPEVGTKRSLIKSYENSYLFKKDVLNNRKIQKYCILTEW